MPNGTVSYAECAMSRVLRWLLAHSRERFGRPCHHDAELAEAADQVAGHRIRENVFGVMHLCHEWGGAERCRERLHEIERLIGGEWCIHDEFRVSSAGLSDLPARDLQSSDAIISISQS